MNNNIKKGILEITNKGFGFLRDPDKNFIPEDGDIFVSKEIINEFHLKEGLLLEVHYKTDKKKIKADKIVSINNSTIEKYQNTKEHKDLISINPTQKLMISQGKKDIMGKMIDLIVPVAKGQRGLIISPAKAGKTTILQHLAKSIISNNPEVKVIILLVDERPEEITDFKRGIPKAKVFHSSADQSAESHMRIARLTISMATRMIEYGEDVCILVDSLTRMARASNKESKSKGRVMSGGLGIKALEIPRKFFGRAKKIEEGGSLTILASILIETGSRLDEVIFNEFKGTGNWDLLLSRECAEQRIFPAIDVTKSATRKDHLILAPLLMEKSNNLRRKIAELQPTEALKIAIRELS